MLQTVDCNHVTKPTVPNRGVQEMPCPADPAQAFRQLRHTAALCGEVTWKCSNMAHPTAGTSEGTNATNTALTQAHLTTTPLG